MERQYVLTSKTVNWQAVRATVNERLGAEYAINYLQNVWRGNLKSQKVMDVMREIIPAELATEEK